MGKLLDLDLCAQYQRITLALLIAAFKHWKSPVIFLPPVLSTLEKIDSTAHVWY